MNVEKKLYILGLIKKITITGAIVCVYVLITSINNGICAGSVKPLFVKKSEHNPNEAILPKKVDPVVTSNDGSTITSFAIPIAPDPKKPGKAIIIPFKEDNMSLTTFTPDQKVDSCLRAIALNASPLVAVRLESYGGKVASWKTKDAVVNALGLLGIRKEGKWINAEDASFSLDITTPVSLEFCVQDNGAIADKDTLLRLIFFHADGSRTYSIIAR